MKNIIVFDLDGTLIQSDQFVELTDYDFTVSYYWDDQFAPDGVGVKVRPGAEQLLGMLMKNYQLALFTHSFPNYIEEVISKAGLGKYFMHTFNNHDEINSRKDLRTVLEKFGLDPQENMDKIVIIDDNQWCLQERNLLLINTYNGGPDNLFNDDFLVTIDSWFTRD